ncbi:hypothetical protein G7054_g11379 [Neopestalotiopsis clavispora]|nr:hypothetical protein G7054_g11379 [Neopestalotiopsis clavispora]
MFEDMAFILPQYEHWFKICRQHRHKAHADRLADSLALIYKDIIEFCLHVYFIFSKQSQGRMRRALIAAKIMLRPFQSKFEKLKEAIDKHRLCFQQFLETTARSAEEESRKWNADKARNVRWIKRWINSSDYESIYDSIRAQAHPNSGNSFVKIPQYLRLKGLEFSGSSRSGRAAHDEWMQRVLFLQGKPGLGKTFASVKIIEDLMLNAADHSADAPKSNVAFFHFTQLDRTKPQTCDGAFRALAEQLIHAYRGNGLTLDAISLIRNEKGSGQHVSSANDVREVLDILLKQHPVFIVIDGVDECNEPEYLLEQVRSICLEHDCRFILLGRPEVCIPMHWQDYATAHDWRIELTYLLVQDDIEKFLEDHFQLLATRGAFGRNLVTAGDLKATLGEGIFSSLAFASEGMFLWARLLLNLIKTPALTPASRLDILRRPTDLVSLDTLYQKILDVLGAADQHQRWTAKKVFQWLAFSAVPLNLTTLHTALAINVGRPTTELDYLTDYPDCIPQITLSLVEVRRVPNKAGFIHLSFKEFLMSGRVAYVRRPTFEMAAQMAPAGLQGDPAHYALDHVHQREGRATPRGGLRDHYHHVPSEDEFSHHLGGNAPISSERPLAAPRGFMWDSANNIQLELGTVCLSYLAHDVPPRPLLKIQREDADHRYNRQAASNTLVASLEDVERMTVEAPTTDKIMSHFPFLRYSTLCWHYHLWAAHYTVISSYGNPSPPESSISSDSFVPLLAQFLLDRMSVTTWVEAAYIFNYPPRLENLVSRLVYLDSDMRSRSAEARERCWVLLGIQQLCEALRYLAEMHKEKLLQNPSLIWQQEITKAEDRNFWPIWNDEPEIKITLPLDPFNQDATMRRDHSLQATTG